MRIPAGSRSVELIEADDMVVTAYRREGEFETVALAAWEALSGPGRLMVDVGAYTGIYAITAALAGSQVIAFEAMRLNYGRMVRNAKLNGVLIDHRRVALGDREGTAEMRFNPAVKLTSGASMVSDRHPGRCMAPMARLDDALDPTQWPVAIKIDVEGAEEQVLRGAAGVIRACRPAILIECLSESALAFVGTFLGHAYRRDRMDMRNWLYRAPECSSG